MTIGIGVLCSTRGLLPDAIVLISDSMGSTETDSTNVLSKMFTRGNVHGVAADSVSVAAELFYAIATQIESLQAPKEHGKIWKAINLAVNGVRSEKFLWQVLRNEHVIENEHMGRVFQSDNDKIQEAWSRYYIGATLLIGTFDDEGQALLYYVGALEGAPGLVHFMQFPGHCSIGMGLQNADAWLNYRQQALNLGVKQSLYHAYEASRMAASAPSVNREIEITIALKDDHSYFGKDRSYPGRYMTSIVELEGMYRAYGPQDTSGISLSFTEASPANPHFTEADP